MSACNILRGADRVHVITDGLGAIAVDPRLQPGFLAAQAGARFVSANKVLALPHLSAAIVVRGDFIYAHSVAALVPMFGTTFDEVRANLATELRPWWEASLPDWKAKGLNGAADIFVAGISETEGPTSFAIVTHDLYGDAHRWSVTDLGAFSMAPMEPSLVERMTARAEETEVDVEALAVDCIEGQAVLVPHEVGAHVTLTTIRPGKVSSRILHRFPLPSVDRGSSHGFAA